MPKETDQQYSRAKNQSEDVNDLIARLLFQLVGLQNTGNSGIAQIVSDGRKRYEHLNKEQNKFVEKVIENIREVVSEKEINLSEVSDGIMQVIEGLESSNLELREGFKALLSEYPETRKEIAKIGQILSQNKPQKEQEKGIENLGKLIVALTQEVKKKELPKDLKLSGPVEIQKPSWWKEFTFSWKPLEDIFEKIKKWTFSVKVENQLDEKVFKNLPEDVAKKLSAVLKENLPKIRISGGGMGNPFSFDAEENLKVSGGSSSSGGAQEDTLQAVLAALDTVETKLQAIADNTDTLEIKADSINLNTDTLESLLTDIRGYVDALENNTAGLGQEATLQQIRDYLDTVETKLDTLNTTLQASQPRDISKAITAMTISLNASGNAKVPAGGNKLRIYSVHFSLSADMTDVSFRFTSGGADFAKFLTPKAGGYYGLNMNQRYHEGGIDEALYCVINGTGTVQVNVNYIEI